VCMGALCIEGVYDLQTHVEDTSIQFKEAAKVIHNDYRSRSKLTLQIPLTCLL